MIYLTASIKYTDRSSGSAMGRDTEIGQGAALKKDGQVFVAIIEDNRDIAALYVTLIEMQGLHLSFIANNGIESVKAFKNAPKAPDVILIDHRMPLMSGMEAMKEILTISPSARFIFISADESMKQEALAAGAKAFLRKPASRKEIIETISRVLHAG